jgi:hypothetical protein
VLALLQLQNTVIAEARPPTPDGNVTVTQRELPDGIVALQATELEGGRQSKGHRHDRIREIALVLVLMQRQTGAWLIAIDQEASGTKCG